MPVADPPLARSIARAHKVVRAWCDRELAEIGASVSEWIVLHNIESAPEPGLNQTDVARLSDMGGPALVRHIDRLEADGIVTRTRDASDRRTIRLQLTPAGRARVEAIRVVVRRCDKEVRGVLSEREAAVMQDALHKLFDHFAGMSDGAGEPTARSTR
jgi:MarR family transcriptional regulator for hemolysin